MSQKQRNTLATTRIQTYVQLSSPESSTSRKQLQTTNLSKKNPTSRESHPKTRPSTGKQLVSILIGKGTPATATPGTIKRFRISAETVKTYEIIQKDKFKAFLKSIMESLQLATQAGKFKLPEYHEVEPLVAKILKAVVSIFDLEVPYM